MREARWYDHGAHQEEFCVLGARLAEVEYCYSGGGRRGPGIVESTDGAHRSTRTSRGIPMNRSRHFLNPLSLGYLLVVAAVVGWVGVDALFVEHADASLAGVWAFRVTAPASLLFVMLPRAWAWSGIVVGAVVNAAALGAAHRSLSGRRPRPTAAR